MNKNINAYSIVYTIIKNSPAKEDNILSDAKHNSFFSEAQYFWVNLQHLYSPTNGYSCTNKDTWKNNNTFEEHQHSLIF